MGVPQFVKSQELAEVLSDNIRVVQYPAAWAGFNLVSDGAAAAQAYMAAAGVIVAAATVADPCWLVGIELGLPQVEAFECDIQILSGAVVIATFHAGTNVFPVVEWAYPKFMFPSRIRLAGAPALNYNIRKSTAASAAGFNICHLLAQTGVGT